VGFVTPCCQSSRLEEPQDLAHVIEELAIGGQLRDCRAGFLGEALVVFGVGSVKCF